jgi:hypothetical protein
MFAYQPMAIHPLALGDVTLKTFGDIGQKEGPEIALTTFDLVLTLKETAIELVGSLIYNLEIFDEAAATEIVKGLYTILQRVVSSPAEARNFVRVSSGDVSVSSPC